MCGPTPPEAIWRKGWARVWGMHHCPMWKSRNKERCVNCCYSVVLSSRRCHLPRVREVPARNSLQHQALHSTTAAAHSHSNSHSHLGWLFTAWVWLLLKVTVALFKFRYQHRLWGIFPKKIATKTKFLRPSIHWLVNSVEAAPKSFSSSIRRCCLGNRDIVWLGK